MFHRTEKAHLFPARSGWGENDAVEVPMVGNQVVDTIHVEMVNKFGGQIAKIVTPDRANRISRTNDNQVHASSYPRVSTTTLMTKTLQRAKSAG